MLQHLLNHLGDGEQLLLIGMSSCSLLNHLGDGELTKGNIKKGRELLNHLGDGEQMCQWIH